MLTVLRRLVLINVCAFLVTKVMEDYAKVSFSKHSAQPTNLQLSFSFDCLAVG